MRAMMYTAPLELQLLDVPDAEVAGDDEVIVEVRAAGICGSELEGIRSQSPFRVPPLVMGHEFAGRRADTGERVVVNPIVACRSCDLCLRGLANVCRHRTILGIQRPGAFADRVSVPIRQCHALPDDLTWEQAAVVEPFANAIHAWRFVPEPPMRVGIHGAGTIGLVMLMTALSFGAAQVDVADLAPTRLARASALGAASVGERLDGEYDVVFDCVGADATRRQSVELLRPGGTAVWVGLHGTDPSFNALDFTRTEKTVQASFSYTDQDFRRAIALSGATTPDWVTVFSLEEGVGIFEQLMGGRTDIVKAVLVPDSAGADGPRSSPTHEPS